MPASRWPASAAPPPPDCRCRKAWADIRSAALGRPDSGEQRVLCAHHDHRQAWSQGADAWQKVQRVLVRQGNVGDHDVALPGGYPAPEGCGDTRRLNLVALPRQSSADDRADGAVIFRQEHLLAAHATSRRKSGSWYRRAAGRRTLKVSPARPAGRKPPHDGRLRSWPPATGRPLPLRLVLRGLDRWSTISNGTPVPLSRTSTVIGSSRRARLLFTATRRPCWYCVARVMVPLPVRRGLGGVLNQVEEHLHSRSRSPSTSGKEGS